MTDEQRKQLAEAIVAMEYGELVKALLDQVETGKMTLEEVLARLTGEGCGAYL
jgi:hypothetical protein